MKNENPAKLFFLAAMLAHALLVVSLFVLCRGSVGGITSTTVSLNASGSPTKSTLTIGFSRDFVGSPTGSTSHTTLSTVGLRFDVREYSSVPIGNAVTYSVTFPRWIPLAGAVVALGGIVVFYVSLVRRTRKRTGFEVLPKTST